MPPVVLSIAVALGVTTTAVYIGLAVVSVMTVFMVSSMNKMKKLAKGAQIDQGRTVQSKDPIAPWRYIYGQIQVSGSMPFMYTTGTINEYLHFIVVIARHECEELGEIRFGEEVIPLDGSSTTSGGGGEATGTYAGHVRIRKFLGSSAGERDTVLESETGGVWKATSVGCCVARLHVRLKHNNDLFQNGLPTVLCLVKGKKVYDWRTATTYYTNNAELVSYDWLTDTKIGKGISLARVNTAVAISDANICDEDVVLADSSTEKRYTINGAAVSEQDPDQTLAEMLASMAGSITDAGGYFTIRAGAWRASSLSLTDSDLSGGFSYQARATRQDTYNGVKGTYISPYNKWVPGDFPVVKNDTYKSWDGGVRLWKEVVYNFITSPAQAQRVAKIDLEIGRQHGVFKADFKLKALQCQPNDTIDFTRPRMEWVAKYFEVQEWGIRVTEGDDGGGAMSISIIGKEIAAACFDWNDGEETTVDLTPDVNVVSGRNLPPTPSGLTLSTSNLPQPDGTLIPRIQVQWTAAADARVTSGGTTEVEYKRTSESEWKHWASIRGDLTEDFISADVLSEVQYKVRIRFRNNQGAHGAYSAEATITPSSDTTAPTKPTGLSATGGAGFVLLTWDNNPSDEIIDHYELYRNTTNTFPGGSPIWTGYANQHADFNVTPSTTYYYWVKASDTSDNVSVASDSVNDTPSAAGGVGTAGNYIDVVFKRSLTAPATPTGDTPSDWSDAPPADDGTYLWMSKGEKTSIGVLTGAWSTPVRLTSPADVAYLHIKFSNDGGATFTSDGGEEVGTFMGSLRDTSPVDSTDPSDYDWTPWAGGVAYVEYSVNGSSSWHSTFTAGDLFARTKIGAGPWTAAYRIVGEVGVAGGYTDYVFKRSASAPATPTGNTPAGWYDAPPAADGNPLWLSTGDKTAAGVLVGAWSTPVNVTGDSISVEFSVDGATSWHSPFVDGDIYMRQRVGSGSWSDPIRVVGEAGAGALVLNPDFTLGASSAYWEHAFGTSWRITATDGESGWGATSLIDPPYQMFNKQKISVKSGERYTIKGHVKGTYAYVRLTIMDASDTELAYITSPACGSATLWKTVEAFGTIPIGAAWMRAEVLGGATQSWCDYVAVERIAAGVEYTPPAAIAPPVQFMTVGGDVTLVNDDPAAVIKYTVNGGAVLTYSTPFTASPTDEVYTWAEVAGKAPTKISRIEPY